MEAKTDSVLEAPPETAAMDVSQAESLNQGVDELFIKVDQLDHKLNEIERFYSSSNKKLPNTPRGGSLAKDKEREKFSAGSFKKKQQDMASREAAAALRMQELMASLGRCCVRMEAKDGTGYKNVREICADVRLIFKNAMKYNEERDDVHVMAKTLLDKFETKWLQLLPKVDEEEERRKEEEAEMQLDVHLAQEAAHAKMARELCFELDEVDTHIEELKDLVLQKCRIALSSKYFLFPVLEWKSISPEKTGFGDPKPKIHLCLVCSKFHRQDEQMKKRLGTAITRLSPEDINKALEIISQNDPTFQASGDTVEVDIDAQSESTLWRLRFFVKDTLQLQMKSSTSTGGNNNGDNNQNCNNTRKRDIPESLTKTAPKKSKKPHN
ncbi:hypothetical protein SASPL_145865 [Salvia splendens]|uniref:NET domain-containing protein n=1 Tax=Salvia splendens TaxID=180675 RepID=A0A8X8WIV6_SALSN|nr:hypothetical protein SASPL_145865 [Salvia splendens]